MNDITLSLGQKVGFDRVMRWFDSSERRMVVAGYAGTGKSTIAKMIEQAVGEGVVFCTLTGKAANVLREKGCENAGTLHSQLYALLDHDRQILKDLEARITEAAEAGRMDTVDTLSEQLAEARMRMRKPKFGLNKDSALGKARLVIVDEYSMLSERLISDLESVAKKVLYMGDPFQLPPIEGDCPLRPDVFLEEIHRQALDSPIIRYAAAVRQGDYLSFTNEAGFLYAPRAQVAPHEYTDADQIIVGLNKTRTAWNQRFRDKRGADAGSLPQVGEKLICLKNNPELELFNGMIGECVKARPKDDEETSRYMLAFNTGSSVVRGINVWAGDINGQGEKYDGYNPAHRVLERFDFGYAITAHKSQGSEFDSVLIYNEPIGRGEEARRWLYTAISRAKKRCVLVEPK